MHSMFSLLKNCNHSIMHFYDPLKYDIVIYAVKIRELQKQVLSCLKQISTRLFRLIEKVVAINLPFLFKSR